MREKQAAGGPNALRCSRPPLPLLAWQLLGTALGREEGRTWDTKNREVGEGSKGSQGEQSAVRFHRAPPRRQASVQGISRFSILLVTPRLLKRQSGSPFYK